MINLFSLIFGAQPCYAQMADPWGSRFAASSTAQMADIFPLFATPVGFIVSILCVCLVIYVIISAIRH